MVNTFSEVYDLSAVKRNKLQEVVKMQMRNILVNIGEADEDEETQKHSKTVSIDKFM